MPKHTGGDAVTPPDKYGFCAAASQVDSDPVLRAYLEQLCSWCKQNKITQSMLEDAKEGKRQIQLPNLVIRDLSLPVRIKEPSIKLPTQGRLVVNSDGSKTILDGERAIYTLEPDEPMPRVLYTETKTPDATKLGGYDVLREIYDVSSDGEFKLRKDTRVKPLKATANAALVLDAVDTLMTLNEMGAFENPSAFIEAVDMLAEATAEYGVELIDAIKAGDVEVVSEALFDSVNPIDPVSRVLKRGADADIPYVDPALDTLAEGTEMVNQAVRDASKEYTKATRELGVVTDMSDQMTRDVMQNPLNAINPVHTVQTVASGLAPVIGDTLNRVSSFFRGLL